MGIKLIKRGDQISEKTTAQQPSVAEITVTAQSWVNEFKQRKSKPSLRSIGGERQFGSAVKYGQRI
jgi:hypothetical protein